MGKNLFIAEKPSVAKEFAKALKFPLENKDGYLEAPQAIVTWCVGHLVTMSYPEVYDTKYKRWSFDTIPFIPKEYKYEVIQSVKKQFTIVSKLLNRKDVSTIYVCTDSGREGEYIYRLVEQMAGVKGKQRLRVWIDSQTEEEILRGIQNAKDLSAYDNLSSAAYLRAKEDYLMGINFSRALTLQYGNAVKNYLKREKAVISVGRVMTCVQGMIVNREREIRAFVKTPFYRVVGKFGIKIPDMNGINEESEGLGDNAAINEKSFLAEWKAAEGSKYYASPLLYKENGFKEQASAQALIDWLEKEPVGTAVIEKIEQKKESKKPPLLYNLAELQNECSKLFKISPDATLKIVQELYEKKMVTYPRTDARVLSSAIAKEIDKNIRGLCNYTIAGVFAADILKRGSYKDIVKSRYVNDKQITDHYAIIPTGQGLNNLGSLSAVAAKVYEVIVRRFFSIFYPVAVYQKYSLTVKVKEERFFAGFKILEQEGYLKVTSYSFMKKEAEIEKKEQEETEEKGKQSEKEKDNKSNKSNKKEKKKEEENTIDEEQKCDEEFLKLLKNLKKGTPVNILSYEIKQGETSPPKRYTSGSIILTMENAGQFIEDEELRAQIKGSGIGTSATRAEILKKLVNIEYLALNKKTQILTPTLMGEMIYDVVSSSIRPLLDPALTASWEKGLTLVAEGSISEEEYMKKLDDFVTRRTNIVKQLKNQGELYQQFSKTEKNYQKK